MSADLHIHVVTDDLTEADFRAFGAGHIGSVFEVPIGPETFNKTREQLKNEDDAWMLASKKMAEAPDIWIGEISWLKAAIFEDASYIPQTVGVISDLIQEWPNPTLTKSAGSPGVQAGGHLLRPEGRGWLSVSW